MTSNRLLCFIIPYFGKLPKEFPCFLLTVKHNPEYNWLLFTDDKVPYVFPSNIKVINCTFDDIRNRIQKKFEFPIALDSPKKLCDYKPAYGYIFEDYINGYDYWGYCDIDEYYGNLKRFIDRSYLEKFERVFFLGHMTIYKNSPKTNTLFMKCDSRHVEIDSYEKIFSSKNNYVFDEYVPNQVNMFDLCAQNGILQCNDVFYYDVLPFKSSFRNVVLNVDTLQWVYSSKNSPYIFYWENGILYAICLQNGAIVKSEIMYVHIQKRRLNIQKYYSSFSNFVIYPNRIISYSHKLEKKDFLSILRRSKFRSVLRIEEIKRQFDSKRYIYKHRAKKVIKYIKNHLKS